MKLRAAIVGTGGIASEHARTLRAASYERVGGTLAQ